MIARPLTLSSFIKRICKPDGLTTELARVGKKPAGMKKVYRWFLDHKEISKDELAEIIGCKPRTLQAGKWNNRALKDGRVVNVSESMVPHWTRPQVDYSALAFEFGGEA